MLHSLFLLAKDVSLMIQNYFSTVGWFIGANNY